MVARGARGVRTMSTQPNSRRSSTSARSRGQGSARQSFLLALLALGGGLVWWLSRGADGANVQAGSAGDATPRTTQTQAADLESDPSVAARAAKPRVGERIKTLPGALEIFGRVSEEDGATITRPDASTRTPDELAALSAKPTIIVLARLEGGSAPERARVDPDGNFTLSGLKAGNWLVAARAIGHVGTERIIELDGKEPRTRADFTLARAKELVVELVVRGAAAGGQARDDALLTRVFAEAALLLAHATPDSTTMPYFQDGSALLQDRAFHSREQRGADWVLRERFDVTTAMPRFASLLVSKRVRETVLVAQPDRPVVFELDAVEFAQHFAGVTARVVDAATGAPLAGAEFFVRQPDVGDLDAEDAALTLQLQRGATDEDGRVELAFLAPGSFDVTVHAPEHERRNLNVELTAGETRDLGTIQLDAPLAIRGQVTGAAGVSLVVEAVALTGTPHAGSPDAARTTIGPDGSFELRGIGRGRYLVRLMQPCELAAAPVEIDTAKNTPVTLAAQRGAQVTFALNTEHVEGIVIDVLDAHAACVVESMRTGSAGRTFVLLAGNYTAIARRGTLKLAEQPFEVAGAPSTVSVTVP